MENRLTRMEDNQNDFAGAIKELKKSLGQLDTKVDTLNSKFDNLTGGKQALMWITGVAIAIAGIIIGFINATKH